MPASSGGRPPILALSPATGNSNCRRRNNDSVRWSWTDPGGLETAADCRLGRTPFTNRLLFMFYET